MKHNPYVQAAQSVSKVKTFDRKTGEPFNPLDVGPKGRSGKRSVSASKMFDKNDELNATSKQDAMQKISALIDGLAEGDYQVERRSAFDDMAPEQSQAILKEAFSDPTSEGFRLVGQGLLNPIKEVIDYEGLARKIWAPRTVKAGEVVRYDKDPFVTAWQIDLLRRGRLPKMAQPHSQ